MEEEYEGQHHTAYHEAGHAIAAIKTPQGAVNYIDICERAADEEENGATVASCPDADDAFYIYAGPWAHVKFYTPDESIDLDRVLACLRENSDDWFAFQQATGHELDDTRTTNAESTDDDLAWPTEFRPSQSWHDKVESVLASAWDEIKDLAQKMLAHEKEIYLSNGQRLVREDTRDRWCDKYYKKCPGGGSGLVGPPPPC